MEEVDTGKYQYHMWYTLDMATCCPNCARYFMRAVPVGSRCVNGCDDIALAQKRWKEFQDAEEQ